MEFSTEKCVMPIVKKRQVTEGIELPNQEIIGTLGEKKNYKFLGMLETSIKRG